MLDSQQQQGRGRLARSDSGKGFVSVILDQRSKVRPTPIHAGRTGTQLTAPGRPTDATYGQV